DADDGGGAVLGHLGEAVLAGRLGLTVLGLALEAAAVELGHGLRHARVRRVVEGLVAAAAHVVGQTDLGAATVGRLAHVVGAAARRSTAVTLVAAPGESDRRHPRHGCDLARSTQDALLGLYRHPLFVTDSGVTLGYERGMMSP